MENQNGVNEVVGLAGSQEALAKHLGVSQQSVQKWAKRGYVPMRRAQEIEAIFGVARIKLADPRVVELLSTWAPAL